MNWVGCFVWGGMGVSTWVRGWGRVAWGAAGGWIRSKGCSPCYFMASPTALPGNLPMFSLDLKTPPLPRSSIVLIADARSFFEGLSPFTLYASSVRAAAKELVGGRTLRPDELRSASQRAKQQWDDMTPEERQMEAAVFQAWRHEPRVQSLPTFGPVLPYRTAWASGERCCFITPSEFSSYISEAGWPTDAMIYNSADSRIASDPTLVDLDNCSEFNLWGCGRHPQNVCKGRFRCVAQSEFAHAGLQNFIEVLDRKDAESGQVLVIFEGKRVATEVHPAQTERIVGLLTGAIFNPKVSDWTLCSFINIGDACTEAMAFPFDVQLELCQCRVTEAQQVIRCVTSSELVHLLTETCNFAEIGLFHATWEVIHRENGALADYRVLSARLVGPLVSPGMTMALIRGRPAPPRQGPLLRQGNPLNAASAGNGGARGRGLI